MRSISLAHDLSNKGAEMLSPFLSCSYTAGTPISAANVEDDGLALGSVAETQNPCWILGQHHS